MRAINLPNHTLHVDPLPLLTVVSYLFLSRQAIDRLSHPPSKTFGGYSFFSIAPAGIIDYYRPFIVPFYSIHYDTLYSLHPLSAV